MSAIVQQLPRLVRAARVALRDGGVREFREALALFLYCRQSLTLMTIDLSAGYTPRPVDPRAEIRPAGPEDLARLRATPEGRRTEFFRDRIDGAEGWVAYWEGAPAHVAWVYTERMPTRFVRLGAGEAELRFGYTLPAFRGLSLYGATNAAMTADLARRGYRRVWGVVVDHGPAFRLGLELALKRIGFERVRGMTYLRVCGVQIRPHLSL